MKKRVAVGSSIGAMIETYDFIGFGIAAALYFNKVFFPANDPRSGLLLSFATLGIGFAVRPLGGIIGGILGDKIGRKPVLVGSLLLMGGATVLIGALSNTLKPSTYIELPSKYPEEFRRDAVELVLAVAASDVA